MRSGSGQRRARVVRGVGFTLLVLVGEWIGHAGTWYLTGGVTPGRAVSGTMHTYLEPVGALVVVSALLGSWLVWRGLRQLARTTSVMRRALRRAWQRGSAGPDRIGGEPGPLATPGEVGIGALWAALVAIQLALYLIQENAEVVALGRRAPGLAVLTAHHASAIAIHATVALLITLAAVAVLERWASRRLAAVRVARLYRALVSRRRTGPAVAPAGAIATRAPRARFGRSFLPRPPPFAFPL